MGGYAGAEGAMMPPTEHLPPLPIEQVRKLADITRNGPLVCALAQEVLASRERVAALIEDLGESEQTS